MTDEDPWRCAVCGEWFVIPSLARDHEAKHEQGEEETP